MQQAQDFYDESAALDALLKPLQAVTGIVQVRPRPWLGLSVIPIKATRCGHCTSAL